MSEINESKDVSVTDAPTEGDQKIDSPEQIELDEMLDKKYNEHLERDDKKDNVSGEITNENKELPEIFDGLSKEDKEKNIEALSNMTDSERAIYMDAIVKEPRITEDIKGFTKENGGELAGLEARVKTPASTYEKMYDREDKTDIRDMNDIVRYTEIYEPDELADATNKNLDQFKEKGYQIDRVKNTWEVDTTPYRGINVNMTSPDGQKFEVQYHTKESFELKNGEMHTKYEECRKLSPDSERFIQLQDEMYELSSHLEKPKDIGKVENR